MGMEGLEISVIGSLALPGSFFFFFIFSFTSLKLASSYTSEGNTKGALIREVSSFQGSCVDDTMGTVLPKQQSKRSTNT